MRYIARFNPLQDIVSLQDAFDRAFDIRWRHPTTSEGKSPRFRLPLDVFEQEEAYTVVASLPGVSVEDIDINLEDDVLSIQANLPEFAAGKAHKRSGASVSTASSNARSACPRRSSAKR